VVFPWLVQYAKRRVCQGQVDERERDPHVIDSRRVNTRQYDATLLRKRQHKVSKERYRTTTVFKCLWKIEHLCPTVTPHYPPLALPSLSPILVCDMSASNPTADPSTADLTAIFDAASNEYKSLTGQNIGTHPLATELERSNSPESILGVFRKQVQALDKFRKGDDKLMKSLTPIVHVIFTLSATLGAGICLVSSHCFYTPVLQYLFSSHSLPRLCFLLVSVFFLG
jgi:hypothetical protein